jgi:hypothetical protein
VVGRAVLVALARPPNTIDESLCNLRAVVAFPPEFVMGRIGYTVPERDQDTLALGGLHGMKEIAIAGH